MYIQNLFLAEQITFSYEDEESKVLQVNARNPFQAVLPTIFPPPTTFTFDVAATVEDAAPGIYTVDFVILHKTEKIAHRTEKGELVRNPGTRGPVCFFTTFKNVVFREGGEYTIIMRVDGEIMRTSKFDVLAKETGE